MADIRPKVVIAARQPPDLTTGGGASYAFYLIEGIKSLASSSGICYDFLPYWGDRTSFRFRRSNNRTRTGKAGLVKSLRRVLWHLWFLYKLHKRLEWARYRRDVTQLLTRSVGVIHAHDSHVAYPLLENYPVVYTHHARGSLVSELHISSVEPGARVISLWRQIDNEVFGKSAVVVFPSQGAYRLALDEYPCLASREIRIIYTGIPDLLKPQQTVREGPERTVLTIAAHVPEKNVPVALEAFYRYILKQHGKEESCFVSLGGYGPDTSRLQRYTERWGLGKRVRLLGRVSREQTMEWLRQAWVFIHMPNRAVFDLALLEALSAGIPVIASRVGGNVEMLGSDWPGYADSAEEAAELLAALGNDDLWLEWSRRARARYERYFTLEKMAQCYLELYEEVMRRAL